MSSTTMTIRLSKEVKDGLGRIASATRRTNSYLAAEAIEAYVARESAIIDGVRDGLADMQAGRVVSHDEAIARLEKTIAAAERIKA
ncbi:Predicted transcriptional regulator [Bosea sp. OK403]|uniref:CopG family ribbon-helix-helix protein n=1 Tax=Bosea sp. OK403 TaxID=1855286 RepID=UPI0008E248C3|nr:CopG family ribbon-helix-helix protein [Bosea sp. OK403]SFH98093.1 Predicted transcriptional regulator [Bosea sp. OK403]